MDKLLIKGPAELRGKIDVSCAKNAYLPILAAVLLNPRKIVLNSLPNLRDIQVMKKLLGNLGVKIKKRNQHQEEFDSSHITSLEATYDLVKTMRASILVLGPLLGRFKKAKVSLPGGCAIGSRPIDIHLENLKKLGANIELQGGYVEASAEKLIGTSLNLSYPSVGATENLMMVACLAEGITTIQNAAREPEVVDLSKFLMRMGVEIEGAGSSEIKIHGIKQEFMKDVEYKAIGDRIEAATYLMGALITRSQIIIEGIDPLSLSSVLQIIEKMGASIKTGANFIHVNGKNLKGITVETTPYPGFPTDLQAQLMALTATIPEKSIIVEKIFENRFMHVPELRRMGANIELSGNRALINGTRKLNAAPVMCTDLRARAALVLAALAPQR
ncbi:MAG: UDP-N-acetylglucosamine 1-carboxyvinyltransferase, partial [Halobacteriovoraceae bacterium]|nr:UDP-N-acetylglucosamine 1-carboxyvinyltransferase [Halobacteriovoraceae bacterium]